MLLQRYHFNLHLCGQSVPSTLNFPQGLQMIKQMICLHISKLTLLGYVIESCSAHREAGVHLQMGETQVNTLTRAIISSLHTPTTTEPLTGLQKFPRSSGERDFGMAQVL